MASPELNAVISMWRAQAPTMEPSVEEMRAGIEAMAAISALAPDETVVHRVDQRLPQAHTVSW